MLFRVVFFAAMIGYAATVWVGLTLAAQPSLAYILANARDYAPPPCASQVCVLTGPGGIWQVWRAHVDKHTALGRAFVVEGICASSCEKAARRVHARLLPGAELIYHAPTHYPTVANY